MGLFGKKSPEEKMMKELIGGFLLNEEFRLVFERWGIEPEKGFQIQRYLKDDIKRFGLTSQDIPAKIHEYLKWFATLNLYDTPTDGNYKRTTTCSSCGKEYAADLMVCPYCFDEPDAINVVKLKNPYTKKQSKTQTQSNTANKANTKECPNCGSTQDKDNRFCIDCGYSFEDLKTCPSCNEKQDLTNRFCISCGYDFNDEPKLSVGEFRKFKFLANQKHNIIICPNCSENILKTEKFCHKCGNEIKEIVADANESVDDDISDLEALYNKSVSEKYSPNFKFAYVIFLNSYGKRFLKSTEREYKITESDLNTQAIKDDYVTLASPLVAARKSKVADLKEILKQHNLKVSGKKDELIQRLGDNLSMEELEGIFPQKSYELSAEGQKFISENDYVLFYEENYNLKMAFTPSEFEMIFKDGSYCSKEEMCSLIIKEIESKPNMDIYDVESLIILYKNTNDQLNLLDNYLKLFIYSINSNMYYSNQDEMNSLYSLLHSLSLDINELKKRFHDAYFNFNLIELKISEKDSFTFLLKLFSGTSIYEIEEEVNQKFFAFD